MSVLELHLLLVPKPVFVPNEVVALLKTKPPVLLDPALNPKLLLVLVAPTPNVWEGD